MLGVARGDGRRSWGILAVGFGGRLIHTAVGSVSGRGGPWTNRSGWAAYAARRVRCRTVRTVAARP